MRHEDIGHLYRLIEELAKQSVNNASVVVCRECERPQLTGRIDQHGGRCRVRKAFTILNAAAKGHLAA
jgi:hypothetical protein